MRKSFYIVFAIFLVLNSCNSTKNEQAKNIITVSILPQKYFVEKIAGSDFEINVLIPPGGSPVTYEPTAKQMADVANSAIYFKIGQIEFEKVWVKKIKANNPELQIYDLSKGINFLEGHTHEKCTDGHNHEGHQHAHLLDPHIWVSPKKVKVIAKNILDALTQEYPDEKEHFKVNHDKFAQEIDSMDSLINIKLKDLESRSFIIFHPALSYFAQDYGLEQISIEIEGKNPSPAHMKKIIDKAKGKNIRIILIQKQFDIENAQTIAKEIDAEVVQIDPLSVDWEQMLLDISENLHKSLSKNHE